VRGCVCSLGIQHAVRTRHIVICGLSGSTIFFGIISHNAKFSKKKRVIDNKMCVLIFSKTLNETFITVRRIEREII